MSQALTLSLIFLDPAAGLIAGAAAGPALILLYLLRLRRRPVRVSSTLLWERAAEDLQANVPLRWLRASLLLLLQLLALASLAMALARPAVLAPDTPSGRVVILIDRSASMAATDLEDDLGRPVSRLQRAVDRADRILRDMPLGARSESPSSAMVVSFAARPSILAAMTSDRASLRRALRDVTPTDQPADLDAAMRLARSFLLPAASESGADSGTIILITDHDPGPQLGSARLVLVGPPPDAERDNVAIVALSARRDGETPSTVHVFARLISTSREPREVPVVLRVNNEPVQSRVVVIPPANPPTLAEQGVSFDASIPADALIQVEIPRADALPSDNAAGAVIRAPGGVRALVVAPDARAAEAITQALAALGAASVREISTAQYESILADRRAIDADLVIFDAVEPAALPPLPSISLGAGLPSLSVRVEPGDNPNRASRFTTWSRAHPVLQHVAMDSVIFPGVGRVETDDDVLQRAGTRVTPLAFGPAGATIVLLQSSVKRIVVGFPLERSSWWIEPGFAVFLANASEFLTGLGAETAARSWTTGTPSVIRAAPGATRVRAVGPITIEAPVIDAGRAGASASLGAIERAGVYRVEGAIPEDSVIAVNLTDAEESALRSTAPAAPATGGAAQVAGGSGDTDAPKELWPWFVLAGAILLTAEWWLYAWRMRA